MIKVNRTTICTALVAVAIGLTGCSHNEIPTSSSSTPMAPSWNAAPMTFTLPPPPNPSPAPPAVPRTLTPSKSGRGFYDKVKADKACMIEYNQAHGQGTFDINLCWPVEGNTDARDRYEGFMRAACQEMSIFIQTGSTWSIEWRPDGTVRASKVDLGIEVAEVRDYYELKRKAGRFPATAPDFPTALKQHGCIFSN